MGAHESGRVGEDPRGEPQNLMPYVAQVAVGKREKVNVFGSDYNTVDGSGKLEYMLLLTSMPFYYVLLEIIKKTAIDYLIL